MALNINKLKKKWAILICQKGQGDLKAREKSGMNVLSWPRIISHRHWS